ncbi:MAG: class I SAM-dependent methyltransferase [Actinomycetota bacterium]
MKYVFDHAQSGEEDRLHEMASLLDTFSRFAIGNIGIGPGARCIEVGAGNGSLSKWLAEQVGPDGEVLATDLDLALMDGLEAPNLTVAQFDVVNDELPMDQPDFIFMRAVVHHLPQRRALIERFLEWVRPGGYVYLEEPDLTVGLLSEPATQAEFFGGFLDWAAANEIDYRTGHQLASWMAAAGFVDIDSEMHTRVYCGGSTFAQYLSTSIRSLEQHLPPSHIDPALFDEFHRLHADPTYWTHPLSFVATVGRRP